MSMFNKSGGGGITPAQLDSLQSDTEAGAQTSTISGTVITQAGQTRNSIAVAHDDLAATLQFVQTTLGSLQAKADAATQAGTLTTTVTTQAGLTRTAVTSAHDDLAATLALVQAALAAVSASVATVNTSVASVSTAVAPASGDVKLVNRASGLASAGYTKAGGMALPDALFSTVRTVLLPYTQGASVLSSYSAAYGQRAMLGDVLYVTSALAFRSYNFGTGAWSNLPTLTSPGATMAPSVLGTVNGKIIETGFQLGANTSISVYTYDPATASHSLRASNPGGYRGFSGIADIGSAQCVLFGGKNVNENTATTATNIVNECRVYNETTNTFTSKASLPVSMAYVRTAVRSDGKVYLVPSATSDGVTLAGASRRIFLWDATTGTTELDPLPAECSTSPWLIQVRSDNCLVFVPVTAPSSGLRARVLNPASASGSQWTGIDWDYNDLAVYIALPQAMEAKASTSGYAITGMTISTIGNVALTATYVATQAPSWSQSFYQIKN